MEGNKKDSASIQVIGAGWGRTGTMSLMNALEVLGYNPCYHMVKNIDDGHCFFWQRVFSGKPYNFDEIFSQYRATTDFPSALFWREQMERYPDAKVVLTLRDEDSWFDSCAQTIFLVMPGNPNAPYGVQIAHFFGLGPARGFAAMADMMSQRAFDSRPGVRDVCVPLFRAHNQDVIQNCSKDKLLVMKISEGWEPLCRFLDVPIPQTPFPRVNDAASFQKHVTFVNALGYSVLGAILVTAIGIGACGYYIFSENLLVTNKEF